MSFLFGRNKDDDDAALERDLGASSSAAPENGGDPLPGERADADAAVTRWRASATSETRARGAHSARAVAVAAAYARWHSELAQISCEAVPLAELTAATVDLTHAHPTGAAQLYSGAVTSLSSLVREERSYQRAVAQAERLRQLVSRLNDVYGFANLSLTAGRATWVPQLENPQLEDPKDGSSGNGSGLENESESEESAALKRAQQTSGQATPQQAVQPVSSSLLMRAVHVEFLAAGDVKIRLLRAVQIHPRLRQALVKAGVDNQKLAAVQSLIDSGAVADAVVAQLSELGREYLAEFSYEPQALLGCFEHPGECLVHDLEQMKPAIESSGVMAALAGDSHMSSLTAAPLPPGDPEDRSPEVERGVGDRDVEELHAVEAVASGRSIVVDCPPGSAELGTVVSIAADAAASGRSVLIVPAHAAVGADLQREFEAAGVGDLVLNFWDRDAVAYRLRTGLRLEKPAVDRNAVLELRAELVKARKQLSIFVNDLHRTDLLWDTSVHDLLEKLADLTAQPGGPHTRVRFTEAGISAIRDAGYDVVQEQLEHAAELGVLDGAYANSLWFAATVETEADAEKSLALVQELSGSVVPEAQELLTAVAQQTGLVPARNPREWIDQINMLDGISESLDTFLPKVFERSPEDMVIATASKEWREERGYRMKHSERRLIRKQVEDLVRPGAAPKDVHAELKLVQERRELWKKYSRDGGWPLLPQGFSQIRAQGVLLEQKLEELSQLFTDVDFAVLPWAELNEKLAALAGEKDRLSTLPERNAALKQLLDWGMGVFIEDMKARRVPAEQVGEEFQLACTSSVFEQLMVNSPMLASLGPRDVSALLDRLRELDTAHVESLAAPVRLAAVSEMRTFARAHRDATLSLDAILAREDTSALKEAFASYPRIVQLARPVWIMPAGLVAEYLPAAPWADVCVIDAGADVPLSAVVAAAMRGRQAVIVGDTRRSALLEVSGADQEDHPQLAISEFAKVLPAVQLPTHRVQLNELSAMALNGHGYPGVYSPIPINPRQHSASLVLLDGKGMPSLGGDGSIETTTVEVEAVIDAIVDHALDRPEQSLIVIAANERHAARVRNAFQKELDHSPVLYEFTQAHPEEPFDIVDITHVNGARRDHVVLTVGFGKTVHGRLLHSFGKLAQPRGFLGLVDAIEAARGELTVMSSIAPGDIDKSKVSTPGPQLLAEVIAAADSGFVSAATGEESEVLAPLIGDLAARLEAAGWKTALNFGFPGSQKIPLVAGSEEIPGVWAVAVLLDDAEYVRERSLRRRDRHRVEAYMQAGWSVFQTYSTSLFVDPAGQAQAVEQLLEAALQSEKTPREQLVVPTVNELGERVLAAESPSGEAHSTAESSAAGSGDQKRSERDLFAANPEQQGAAEAAQSPVPATPVERGERPEVSVGMPLAAYTDDELDDMLVWIASDQVPRTQQQLLEELRNELGIERRGGQTDLVLGNVVRRSGLAAEPQVPAETAAPQPGSEPLTAEVEAAKTGADQSLDERHSDSHTSEDASENVDWHAPIDWPDPGAAR
ncbi:MAG: hypothetical protein SPF30_04915 [Arcanobacterium sp.]|nr:hypothetical protein [Arcanobacterium sp.]